MPDFDLPKLVSVHVLVLKGYVISSPQAYMPDYDLFKLVSLLYDVVPDILTQTGKVTPVPDHPSVAFMAVADLFAQKRSNYSEQYGVGFAWIM